jgi:Ca2+/Na+ antiporter
MYIASKALSDAIVGGRTNAPGRLAIAQWLPLAVLALMAVLTNRPAIAMGLIFSSSVACLCLSTGAVALLGLFPAYDRGRRSWTLLLPAALLVLLAGFQGAVTLFTSAIFIAQGLVVLLIWTDRKTVRAEVADETTALQTTALQTTTFETATFEATTLRQDEKTPARRVEYRRLQCVLALAVACVGAWLALHGVERVAQGSEFASAGLLTATLLSPLLVLPMIGSGTEMAQKQQSSAAVDSHMGVVLLNICALLPMAVTASYFRQWFMGWLVPRIHLPWVTDWLFPRLFISPVPASISTSAPVVVDYHALAFPLGVWRVDVVMLIALGLFLLPVALGRWIITRQQGLWMMVGYAVYLTLAIKYQGYILYGVR